MQFSLTLLGLLLVGQFTEAQHSELEVDNDYYDYFDLEDSNTVDSSIYAPSRRDWKTITDTVVKERTLMSLGCPRRAGMRDPAGKVSVVFTSPTTFEDVKIKLDPDDMNWTVMQLIEAGFNVTQNSVMYAHGWTEGPSQPWGRKLRRRYANIFRSAEKRPTYNLLFLDYHHDAHMFYRQTVSKVPALAALLAQFLNALKPFGCTMEQFHILGFSLSAHIVGVAGLILRRAGNPIRQITGLDPAGPCFFRDSDFAHEYTLSPDAANLVVTRHYGYNKLGAHALVGGLDILINGGKDQPVSGKISAYGRFKMLYGVSDHMAAVFHESGGVMSSECYDVAYKCDNYANFLDGACARCDPGEENHCYTIGTLISGANRALVPIYDRETRMFIKMGGKRYCLYHYQLVVELRQEASNLLRSLFDNAKIRVNLGTDTVVKPKKMLTCAGTVVYTVLVTSESQLSHSMDVTLATSTPVSIEEFRGVKLIRFNYMSHPIDSSRRAKSFGFCQNEANPLSFLPCEVQNRGIAC